MGWNNTIGGIPIKIKIEHLLILMAYLLLLLPTIKATIDMDRPTAEDWNRHGEWIEQYMGGNFSQMAIYPPTYHFFMMPFVLLLGSNIQLLQPIFITISFFSILYFVWKYEDDNAVLLTSLMLGTSIIFLQYAPALIPQTLDFALYPVMFIALFEKRYNIASIILIFLVGMHLMGLFALILMVIYSLLTDRKYLKHLYYIILISALLFGTSYINSTKGWETFNREDMNMQSWSTEWDVFYTYPLWHFLLFSGVLIWFLLPLTIYSMYRVKKYDKYQLLYAVWFLVLLPLIFFNVWRWWSYACIPATLFTASIISDYIREKEMGERVKTPVFSPFE